MAKPKEESNDEEDNVKIKQIKNLLNKEFEPTHLEVINETHTV